MPIIKSNKKMQNGIVDYSENSEFVQATHVEEVGSIFKANREKREHGDGIGMSDNKSMRQIASIPALMWVEAEKKYPDLLKDKKQMKAFLKSPEGRLCLTTRGGI